MAPPPVIDCRGVTKRFYHYEHRTATLQEFFVRTVLGRPIHVRHAHFQLCDFNLRVETGEAVALVGANGSGKSTALRLIAGIYPPTEGTVECRGRIVAVMALGAAFHEELTGAENVRLYAAALGLTRQEVAACYADVVGFAEIDEFLDTPLKYYSTGMRARLAFSVAVCASPDALLLDEVLAVGDEGFKRRCLERLQVFQERRGTLVLVSHDWEDVLRTCTRAVWLDHGRVALAGETERVLNAYRAASTR
jgi:ABC-type polysaccharide/polyol phosphate transport system ATPase subunit